MSKIDALEQEILDRRQADKDRRDAVNREIPVRFEKAKVAFIESAKVSEKPLEELGKRLEDLIVPYQGWSHMRTRWGLRYSFTDAHDAAKAGFDRAYKAKYVMNAEAELKSIVDSRYYQATDAYGIKTHMMNWFLEGIRHEIHPVMKDGDFKGFSAYHQVSGSIRYAVTVDDKRDILTADEVEGIIRKSLREHIEIQRHPKTIAMKAGTAAAIALGVNVLAFASLPEDVKDRIGGMAQNIPFVKGP